MYKFSYVQSVAGKATEVNKDLFHEIITSEKVKSVCAKIAQTSDASEVSKLKRSLPAFCWHAWFDEGKRKNYAAHASGLIMIDVDHVEEPRELYHALVKNCGETSTEGTDPAVDKTVEKRLGGHLLLAAHVTPSTKGLRLVFAIPLGADGNPLDIVAAQTKIVKDLKLKNVDACTKDLARLSFCVPEEYFLYVDEEALFEGPCLEGNTERSESNRGQRPTLYTHLWLVYIF